MKKILGLILVFVISVVFCTTAIAHQDATIENENVAVYVNGELINTDQAAIIVNGRTMVPLRAVAEMLNCNVSWDNELEEAHIRNEITSIKVKINSFIIVKMSCEDENNTREIKVDVPPILYNDRTMVPVRAISEAFNAGVNWNDSKQCVEITLKYDIIDDYGYQGLARVKKDGKWGMIDSNAKEIVPLEYEYISLNSGDDGYIDCQKNGKWGLFDKDFNVVIPAEYDVIFDMANGHVRVVKDDKYGLFDKDFNVVIPAEYDLIFDMANGHVEFEKDGKYGLFDQNYNVVVPAEYDMISAMENGYVKFEKDGKYGLFAQNYNVVVPAEYSDIFIDADEGLIYLHKEKNNIYNLSVYDIAKGEITSSGDYKDEAFIVNGYEIFHENGKYGVRDEKGNIVHPAIYDDFSVDSDYIYFKKDGKWGIFDKDYKVVVPAEYDSIGYSYVLEAGYRNVEKDGKYGILDENFNLVVPAEYDSIYDMQPEGYAVFEKDNRFGMFDKNYKVVVPAEYGLIFDFNNGYARFSKDGKYGKFDLNLNEIYD